MTRATRVSQLPISEVMGAVLAALDGTGVCVLAAPPGTGKTTGVPLALLPATERLARMPTNRWIGYTRANQAITLLGRMLAKEAGRIRPRNLLIVGPTNNGKTAIAERFLRDHPQRPSENGEHEIHPVLLVQMPPAPTVSRLYAAPRRSWCAWGTASPIT